MNVTATLVKMVEHVPIILTGFHVVVQLDSMEVHVRWTSMSVPVPLVKMRQIA